MEKIYFIEDYQAYLNELESLESEHKGIRVRRKDNKALFATQYEQSHLATVELLGAYDEIFADEVKHNIYKSVNDYHIDEYYTDEEGIEHLIPKNKYIGMYARTAPTKDQLIKELDLTTLPSGLRFYTDDKSMVDLLGADRQAERLGAVDEDTTDWKTPDGIKEVTIGDIRKAIDLRLERKGEAVGVTSGN